MNGMAPANLTPEERIEARARALAETVDKLALAVAVAELEARVEGVELLLAGRVERERAGATAAEAEQYGGSV